MAKRPTTAAPTSHVVVGCTYLRFKLHEADHGWNAPPPYEASTALAHGSPRPPASNSPPVPPPPRSWPRPAPAASGDTSGSSAGPVNSSASNMNTAPAMTRMAVSKARRRVRGAPSAVGLLGRAAILGLFFLPLMVFQFSGGCDFCTRPHLACAPAPCSLAERMQKMQRNQSSTNAQQTNTIVAAA